MSDVSSDRQSKKAKKGEKRPGEVAEAASTPSLSSLVAQPRPHQPASASVAPPASKLRVKGKHRSIASSSDLDSLFNFTSNASSITHQRRPSRLEAAAAAVPYGFENRDGVLQLSAQSEAAILNAESKSQSGDPSHKVPPSASTAPDLLAHLSASAVTTTGVLPTQIVNPIQAKKEVKKSGPPSAGKGWFNFSRPSALTTEMKQDLTLLSLRAYMDPKKFFKKESKNRKKKVVPTFFQVGTVIAGAQDFYSSRLARSERTEHYADEFIDPQRSRSSTDTNKTKKYLKRKVIEVQNQNRPAPRIHVNKTRKMMEDASKRPGSAKKNKNKH